MSGFKPYPEYKDSGIEWIGSVPDHWNITKLKYISNIIMGQSPDPAFINNQSKGFPFLQGNAEFTSFYPRAKHYSTELKKVSKIDDILFSVRAPVGAMNLSDTDYVIGRGLCSINNKEVSLRDYVWFLLKCIRVELFSKMTGSTFEAVTITDVRESNAILPDILEQKKISHFLNIKTIQIDTLIADKERLIELLEEKRQAVITETVTKGLDPNVAMKDSGIEWIGEIPEHWQLIKLKYLTKMKSGESLNAYDIYPEGKYEVYGGGGFRGYTISYTHEGEYILIGRQGALCGVITFVSGKFWATEHAITVKNKNSDIEWLRYLLENMDLNQYSISAAQPGLSVNKIINLVVPVPPIDEQKEITCKIKYQDSNIKILNNKVEQQISKLKEYRESLIYEAVTGKIDVRDYGVEIETEEIQ